MISRLECLTFGLQRKTLIVSLLGFESYFLRYYIFIAWLLILQYKKFIHYTREKQIENLGKWVLGSEYICKGDVRKAVVMNLGLDQHCLGRAYFLPFHYQLRFQNIEVAATHPAHFITTALDVFICTFSQLFGFFGIQKLSRFYSWKVR